MTDASTPERTYWYQCQEQSMAPGIGDGWPEIIPAPHTPNARLKRMEGDPTSELATLRARVAELEGVVERLPKLGDGPSAYPGRACFVRDKDANEVVLGEVAVDQYSGMLQVRVYRADWKQGNGGYEWFDLRKGYSTRSAAVSAVAERVKKANTTTPEDGREGRKG